MSVVRSCGPAVGDRFGADDARWISEQHSTNGRVYFPETAVVSFSVGDIPEQVRANAGDVFGTRVVHDPYDDLYPHSQVHVLKDGQVITGHERDVQRSVRRVLRDELARRAIVAARP